MMGVKSLLTAAVLFIGFGVALAATPVRAIDIVDCSGLTGTAKQQCAAVSQDNLNYKKSNNYIWDIVRFLFIIIGGLATIMIVVGGIQYATSQGESATLQKAKNTILYSVIGLVVALLAAGVVTFIVDNVAK